MTGQVGGQGFSVHAEGERMILTREGVRQEVDLTSPLPGDVAVGATSAPTELREVVCPGCAPPDGVAEACCGDELQPGLDLLPDEFSRLDDALSMDDLAEEGDASWALRVRRRASVVRTASPRTARRRKPGGWRRRS